MPGLKSTSEVAVFGKGSISRQAVSQNEEFLLIATTTNFIIYDIKGESAEQLFTFPTPKQYLTACGVSNDGLSIAYGSIDSRYMVNPVEHYQSLFLFRRGKGEIKISEKYSPNKSEIENVFFLKDQDTLLTCTDKGHISLWDLNKLEENRNYNYPDTHIKDYLLSDDGSLLIIWSDIMGGGAVGVYNIRTGQLLHTVQTYGVFGVALSADNKRLAVCGDRSFILDLATGEQTYKGEFPWDEAPEWAKAPFDHLSKVVNLRKKLDRIIPQLGYTPGINEYLITPDSKGILVNYNSLSVLQESVLTYWDITTKRKVFEKPMKAIKQMSISPDGAHLAVIMKDPIAIQILSFPDLEIVKNIEEPALELGKASRHGIGAPSKKDVNIQYSNDGGRIVVSDEDGKISVIQPQNGKLIWSKSIWDGTERHWTPITLSPDGQYFLTYEYLGEDIRFAIIHIRDGEVIRQGRVSRGRSPIFFINSPDEIYSCTDSSVHRIDYKNKNVEDIRAKFGDRTNWSGLAHCVITNNHKILAREGNDHDFLLFHLEKDLVITLPGAAGSIQFFPQTGCRLSENGEYLVVIDIDNIIHVHAIRWPQIETGAKQKKQFASNGGVNVIVPAEMDSINSHIIPNADSESLKITEELAKHSPIRLVIISKYPNVREAFRVKFKRKDIYRLLGIDGNKVEKEIVVEYLIVKEISTAGKIKPLLLELKDTYDVVLIERDIPGLDIIEIIRYFKSIHSGAIFLNYSYLEESDIQAALAAGAAGGYSSGASEQEIKGMINKFIRRNITTLGEELDKVKKAAALSKPVLTSHPQKVSVEKKNIDTISIDRIGPYSVLIVDCYMGPHNKNPEYINGDDNLFVIGIANDGKEGIKKYFELNPDVVLMETTMPNMDGFTATEEICKRDPSALIAICSVWFDDEKTRKAILAGARNFIPKPASKAELVSEIKKMVSKTTIYGASAYTEDGIRLLREKYGSHKRWWRNYRMKYGITQEVLPFGVLIVEEKRETRAILREFIESDPDLHIVDEVAHGRDIASRYKKGNPLVISMNGENANDRDYQDLNAICSGNSVGVVLLGVKPDSGAQIQPQGVVPRIILQAPVNRPDYLMASKKVAVWAAIERKKK